MGLGLGFGFVFGLGWGLGLWSGFGDVPLCVGDVVAFIEEDLDVQGTNLVRVWVRVGARVIDGMLSLIRRS